MTRGQFPVKSTIIMRSIANPRRTTLAHLVDAADLQPASAGPAEPDAELPQRTANPRRTTLIDEPAG
jgi:hypothetical protein